LEPVGEIHLLRQCRPGDLGLTSAHLKVRPTGARRTIKYACAPRFRARSDLASAGAASNGGRNAALRCISPTGS